MGWERGSRLLKEFIGWCNEAKSLRPPTPHTHTQRYTYTCARAHMHPPTHPPTHMHIPMRACTGIAAGAESQVLAGLYKRCRC